jgi:hypothetical protein
VRVSFLVYGVLYLVTEIVGAQIEAIGWPQLTPLDVATAVANACLTVAVGTAVLVAVDVLGRRWRRSVEAWRQEQVRLAEQYWDEQPPIGVPSWRPTRLALPAGPSWDRPADGDYAAPARGRPFPEEPGRLL